MRLRHTLLWLLVLPIGLPTLCAAAAAGMGSAAVDGRASEERPQDAVWLFSTRHLGCPRHYDRHDPGFQIARYDWGTGWQDSDFDAFLNTEDPQTRTVVYVHGNRVDWCTALHRGLLAYRSLVCGVEDPQPIRFVIWSWPSTQICGPLRDVRAKAARSDYDSHYLAWFLARLHPDTPVGLFGFSYGGRIICGALHVLGGGHLLGMGLDEDGPTTHCKARVVLMGSATHNYWLLPHAYHGRCLSEVDRMLVQYNPADHVLGMYHLLDRCTRAHALGHTGLSCPCCLGEDAARIEQQNVCCAVGDHHDARVYFASPTVMMRLRQCILQP